MPISKNSADIWGSWGVWHWSVVCGLLLCGVSCTPPAAGPTAVPPRGLASEQVASSGGPSDKAEASSLQGELDAILAGTLQNRQLNTDDHGAWQILHGALAYGTKFPVRVGREGEFQPAIEFAVNGGKIHGWTFQPGDVLDAATGRRGLRAVVEPGTRKGQGHADQWLAILAQAHLPADQPIKVAGQTFLMRDLVEQVQRDLPFNAEREWSWSLIGLSAYLDESAEWTAADGETWSTARMLTAEIEQDIDTSACGGTHRLIGIATAVTRHRKAGGSVEAGDVWQQSHELVQDAIRKTLEYQNQDGSFSAQYLRRPSSTADIGTLLGTTGHLLEFLTVAMTDEQLKNPQVAHAVRYLNQLLETSADLPLECGALYHAVHGLVLYRVRTFGPVEYDFDPTRAPTSPSETLAE